MTETPYSRADLARLIGVHPNNVRRYQDALDMLHPTITPQGYRYSEEDAILFCTELGREYDPRKAR